MYVLRKCCILVFLNNPYFRKSPLPNLASQHIHSGCPKRKASFNQLNNFFNADIGAYCQKNVEMIRHQNKFMKKIVLRVSILEHRSHKQLCR